MYIEMDEWKSFYLNDGLGIFKRNKRLDLKNMLSDGFFIYMDRFYTYKYISIYPSI